MVKQGGGGGERKELGQLAVLAVLAVCPPVGEGDRPHAAGAGGQGDSNE